MAEIHNEVHNRSRYQAGCKCDVCRKAQSDYRKRLRQRKNAGRQLGLAAPVDAGPAAASSTPVSDAVRLELDMLGGAAEIRPGLAAAAMAMAAILDTPLYVGQAPAAAGRLVAILGMLHKLPNRRGGFLTSVRAMTPLDGRGDSGGRTR
jgi:hypothetical protein